MAFETNTSCCGGKAYPCGGMALAAFEVVTPTAKMVMPMGDHQDSFGRGVCGPDLSGALCVPSGSALV